jgi:16S rRNA processing protein RimM
MDANPIKKIGDDSEKVFLGRISGVHGVKGLVRIFSDTEPREAIFDYQPWLLGEEQKAIQILDGRKQGKHLIAELDGVTDRDGAENLVGLTIAITRDHLPELSEEYYYWTDLIGLRVIGTDGFEFGSISEMIATGANDVMLVKGDKERLIPFIQNNYVKQVDLEAGSVLVEWDPEF